MRDTELALGSDVATAARRGYSSFGRVRRPSWLEGMRQALSARFKRRSAANDDSREEGAA